MNIKFIIGPVLLVCFFASCKETNEQLINKGVRLSNENRYDEAIAVYTEVIRRNPKLQLPYYNRGIVYTKLEKYNKALDDFNKIMSQKMVGSSVYTPNPNSPFADEEARASVTYYDALYQRALVKYHMDSLQSSYTDFNELIQSYYDVSNCYLWQGVLWIKAVDQNKACERFDKAMIYARTEEDRQEAERMTKEYCVSK